MTGTATYNVGDGPEAAKVADLTELATRADVIGLQEASDRDDALNSFLRTHPGWGMHRPTLPGAKAVPILYNTETWTLLRAKSRLAVARKFVGRGAGPSWAKPKPVNVAVLESVATGETWRYLNTHFIASATRKPAKRFRLRRDHYDAHAHVLARMIGKKGSPRMRRTVVTGDFNAEWEFPLLAPVRATGINRGWTDGPTHGKRSIDFVLGPDGKRSTVKLSSDHRAVVT